MTLSHTLSGEWDGPSTKPSEPYRFPDREGKVLAIWFPNIGVRARLRNCPAGAQTVSAEQAASDKCPGLSFGEPASPSGIAVAIDHDDIDIFGRSADTLRQNGGRLI